MKLCPQCEFIYEDDQSICDMDGKELVYDPGPLASGGTVSFTSPELCEPAPLPVSVTASLPASSPMRWQSRRSAVAALAAIILVALLCVVYYARTHQSRASNAKQASNQSSTQSSNQTTQLPAAAQEPSPDLASAAPESFFPSPEQSSSASPNETTSSPSALAISSAVSAGGSAADGRAPVIIWLRNGASIKADEAWEKREGVWYRQAGMVTFLKRSRVRAIQRLRAPNPRLKSPAIGEEQNRDAIAQNQPRIFTPEDATAKPEAATAKAVIVTTRAVAATTKPAAATTKPAAATTKKESRVSSFLKKTGRILKKPFKL